MRLYGTCPLTAYSQQGVRIQFRFFELALVFFILSLCWFLICYACVYCRHISKSVVKRDKGMTSFTRCANICIYMYNE